MTVSAEIVEASEYYTSSGDGPNIIGDMETADGEAVVGLQASDVKPGDWVIICFEIDIGDNPGYVQISTDDFAQYENGQTEPEAIVDNTGGGSLGTPLDGQGNGELQDELLAEVYGTYNSGDDGDPPRSFLKNKDPSLSGSARTTYEQFATGIVIGGPADPLEVGSGDDAIKRYLLLELPVDVGNEVQSDAIEFDLVFDALQVRNNDGFDPSSSLVGYWPLNDVENAPVEDISGNGNDGTVQGDVSAVSGQVANAALFDGTDDYIQTSYTPSLSDSLSIVAWVSVPTTKSGRRQIVSPDDAGFDWSLLYDENNNWALFHGGGVLSGPSVTTGKATQVAGVWDIENSETRLYIDGNRKKTGPISTGSTTNTLRIGDNPDFNENFNGWIDDVRIYDRALSDTEVADLYNETN